MIKVVTVIFYW